MATFVKVPLLTGPGFNSGFGEAVWLNPDLVEGVSDFLYEEGKSCAFVRTSSYNQFYVPMGSDEFVRLISDPTKKEFR